MIEVHNWYFPLSQKISVRRGNDLEEFCVIPLNQVVDVEYGSNVEQTRWRLRRAIGIFLVLNELHPQFYCGRYLSTYNPTYILDKKYLEN